MELQQPLCLRWEATSSFFLKGDFCCRRRKKQKASLLSDARLSHWFCFCQFLPKNFQNVDLMGVFPGSNCRPTACYNVQSQTAWTGGAHCVGCPRSVDSDSVCHEECSRGWLSATSHGLWIGEAALLTSCIPRKEEFSTHCAQQSPSSQVKVQTGRGGGKW